jgi:hypothetical protein
MGQHLQEEFLVHPNVKIFIARPDFKRSSTSFYILAVA